jgi:hypothetical protein
LLSAVVEWFWMVCNASHLEGVLYDCTVLSPLARYALLVKFEYWLWRDLQDLLQSFLPLFLLGIWVGNIVDSKETQRASLMLVFLHYQIEDCHTLQHLVGHLELALNHLVNLVHSCFVLCHVSFGAVIEELGFSQLLLSALNHIIDDLRVSSHEVVILYEYSILDLLCLLMQRYLQRLLHCEHVGTELLLRVLGELFVCHSPLEELLISDALSVTEMDQSVLHHLHVLYQGAEHCRIDLVLREIHIPV